jgi:hypothetical protein
MNAADTQNTTENTTDELAALCADLLAEVRYEPFVLRLLAEPAGRWQPLTNLVVGLEEVQAGITALEQTLSCQTWTAWLEHPDCAEGPGYVTVVFFNEGGMSRVWIYNRDRVAPHLKSPLRSE